MDALLVPSSFSSGGKMRSVLSAAAFAVCSLGFAWVVRGQCKNFLDGKTAVAVQYKERETHQVPDLVFCSGSPFLPNVSLSHLLTAESHASVTLSPEVDFIGIIRHEYDAPKIPDGAEWSDLDTVYNGRCRKFRLGRGLATGDFAGFVLKDRHPVDLFILQPGDDVFLLWQNWGSASAGHVALGAPNSLVVSLFPNTFRYLEGHADGGGCRGSGFMAHSDCIRSEFRNKLVEEDDPECMPSILKTVIDVPQLPTCGAGQENASSSVMKASAVLASEVNARCPISCSFAWWEVRRTPFYDIQNSGVYKEYSSSSSFSESSPSRFPAFVHFPSSLETLHSQYVLYDFVSIVSSVGGGLGLFLGFSCLTICLRGIELVSKKRA